MDHYLSRAKIIAAAAGLAVALAGCTGGGDPADQTADAEVTGPARMEVIAPQTRDEVTVPFEVLVDSEVDLGAAESGYNHLRVWFNDDSADFVRYDAYSGQVERAPAGEVTLWAQVYSPDEEPVSDPFPVEINIVAGGDEGGEAGTDQTGGGDGY